MIYLDNAASAPVLPEVLEAMLPWFQPANVGNPGSLHGQGSYARRAVEEARGQVAALIGAEPSEIFFTSGATEANNMWLSCVEPCVVSPTVILTSGVEHHSVLEPIRNSRDLCAEYIRVREDGTADLEDLERKLRDMYRIMAVSLMCVNNEIGSINPVLEIGAICKKYDVPLHVDATAAAGHIPINVRDCGVSFLSLAGHKFGAPQGVGALYIASRVKKSPLLYGGGQEKGMRPGTENVPGIVALGTAAEIAALNMERNWKHAQALRSVFMEHMSRKMTVPYRINGGEHVAPHIISLTVPGVNSESLLHLMDLRGFCISAGSACSASREGVSHVLLGAGMTEDDASCTVRISTAPNTTTSDMMGAAYTIAEISKQLTGLY